MGMKRQPQTLIATRISPEERDAITTDMSARGIRSMYAWLRDLIARTIRTGDQEEDEPDQDGEGHGTSRL